jgi:hypothetical protein
MVKFWLVDKSQTASPSASTINWSRSSRVYVMPCLRIDELRGLKYYSHWQHLLEITYRNGIMHLPADMPFATRISEAKFEVSHYTACAVTLSISYAGHARISLQMRHMDPFRQSPS